MKEKIKELFEEVTTLDNSRVEYLVVHPEEGIVLEFLVIVPSDFPREGSVEDLKERVPVVADFLEEGIQEARKRMAETGENTCVLEGRVNVPALIKGIARHKGNQEWLEPDQTGIVTAYLPEQNIFAVDFGEGKWITFQDWTEEQFLEQFDTVVIF